MNAAPPVSQAQPLNDAVQPEAPASAASTSTRAGSQDFAVALSDAGAKPARKSAANKQQDSASSGSSLPPPGNQPPVALQPPPPAKAEPLAATVADAAALVKDPQSGAQGAAPSAIAAASASTAPANGTGATTILASANLASPTPALDADTSAPSPADGPTASGSGRPAPQTASVVAAPGTSSAATTPQLPATNAPAARSSNATAKQGTIRSDSALSSNDANALNDSTLNNGPDASGTDAAAQAVMAAAIVQGKSEPAQATPDTTIAQGAANLSDPAANAPAANAPAAAMARAAAASISAAVTAATATAVALAASDAASASAADKRSHVESPEATLSGASNDGSAGAAQLLTSNSSTDSAPSPTFKVAAGVDTAQFGQGVADRVSLMMDGNLTSAKLQVNPPALGPIEVRIALQGGHAQVSFSSHSAVTRDALESSSEKLREMLGSQGFSSVSVDISQRSFQERSPQSQAYETAPGDNATVLAQTPLSMARSASGLLDAYA